jgi:hypothetical protein
MIIVVNKVMNGIKYTIVWYVDNLKIAHQNKHVVSKVMKLMRDEYGKVHDYIGIQIDFSNKAR